MNEHELIIALQNGDLQAFDAIFELYKNVLLRTAYLITGSYAHSEDIVQETFVQCYLKINTLKDTTSFKSWIYKIMTRLAWHHSQKERSYVPVDTIFETIDTSLPAKEDPGILAANGEFAQLYQSINTLNQKQRTVIVLFYFNDFSIKEIARVTSSLEATVKSRLYQAKKSLKKQLEQSKSVKGVGMLYEKR